LTCCVFKDMFFIVCDISSFPFVIHSKFH
jgi:hypothetical protein